MFNFFLLQPHCTKWNCRAKRGKSEGNSKEMRIEKGSVTWKTELLQSRILLKDCIGYGALLNLFFKNALIVLQVNNGYSS